MPKTEKRPYRRVQIVLDPESDARLNRLAGQYHTSRSAAVRLLLMTREMHLEEARRQTSQEGER